MGTLASTLWGWLPALVLSIGLFVPHVPRPADLNVREVDGEAHQRGWIIESGSLRVKLLRLGGHIAEIRVRDAGSAFSINPLFVPSGTGYSGHLVCFPHYGPASADEREQGLRGHGEAGAVEWRETRPAIVTAAALTFFYGAELPKTHYTIERAVTVRAGEPAVRVDEWVENRAGYDRPYNWNQHATFGAPFAAPDANVLDVSGGAALTDPRRTGGGQWAPDAGFEWPNAPTADGGSIALRPFRARPDGQVYTAIRTAAPRELAWFTLYNLDQRLLVGYLFPAADHPWIVDWQNRPAAEGAARTARGIQFGTSPFDEGLRKSVERGRLFDTPTYRWIGARQRLSTSFHIFLTDVPSGFAGVADVRAAGDHLTLRERGTAREITVHADVTRGITAGDPTDGSPPR
jgi:hypothetical protein